MPIGCTGWPTHNLGRLDVVEPICYPPPDSPASGNATLTIDAGPRSDFPFRQGGTTELATEVGPALLGFIALALTYRRLPLSDFCYVCVFLHTLVLIYGGYYTYAETPLGNWAKEAFHLSRNHYDRVGHLAFGFFPVFIIKEVLPRVTPLRRGGWFYFLVLSVSSWLLRLSTSLSNGGLPTWWPRKSGSPSSGPRAIPGHPMGHVPGFCWSHSRASLLRSAA